MSIQDDLAAMSAQRNNQMKQDMVMASDPSMGPKLQYNPIDEATGLLKKQYQQQGGAGYTQALLAKQGLDQANAQDASAAQTQGALTNANAGLSMRGGLNTANRANMARANMQTGMQNAQSVGNQGLQARANINTGGAQQDIAANNANIQGAISGIGGVNNFNLDKYKSNMAGISANNTAAATMAASQNSGSWVCTQAHIRDPLNKKEALALFRLRKFALKNYKALSQAYLYEFQPLVDRMLTKGEDWTEVTLFVKKVISLVEEKRMQDAFDYYVGYIQTKVDIYWPDCKNAEFLKLKGEI